MKKLADQCYIFYLLPAIKKLRLLNLTAGAWTFKSSQDAAGLTMINALDGDITTVARFLFSFLTFRFTKLQFWSILN